MTNTTSSLRFLMNAFRLASNRSQVRGVVNGNGSDDVTPAKGSVERLLRLFDMLILSMVCVGLVGNALAFSALCSRGCRGRRRRWRTHHTLAILLQVRHVLLRDAPSTHILHNMRNFVLRLMIAKSSIIRKKTKKQRNNFTQHF